MSNARAARRRAEKDAAKPVSFNQTGPKIQMVNPVAQWYEAFIIGNAQFCEYVVEEGSAKGQSLVLCGAGPSLAEDAAAYCPGADQLWGCNSALIWLQDHGYKPTHGFCIDQTPEMVREWYTAPDVEYLVASTIHPHLTEYLMGRGRRLRWFHNFVGLRKRPVALKDDDGIERIMAYEDWMYSSLFTGTVRAGSGLNSVTRALDVALYMGFDKITVLGADCALRIKSKQPEGTTFGSPEHKAWLKNETTMHADGGSAVSGGQSPLTLGAEIDGRWWETKIDLVISAVWLTKMECFHGGRIVLVGDTLPVALREKDDAFLDRLPGPTGQDGRLMKVSIQDPIGLETLSPRGA